MSAGAWAVLLAATPSPSPTPIEVPPEGSPGFLGFVFTFALAIAAILLALSLTRHLRIVDRRAAQVAREDEERAARTGEDEVPGDGPAVSGPEGAPRPGGGSGT